MGVYRNTLHTFLIQIPNVLFGILSMIFIARLLGAEGMGNYTIFQVSVQALSLFLGLGLQAAIVYYTANQKVDTQRLFNTFFLFILCILFLSVVLIFTAGRLKFMHIFLPEGYDKFLHKFLLISATSSAVLNTFFSSLFNGKQKIKTTNYVTLFAAGTGLITYSLLYGFSQIGAIEVNVDSIMRAQTLLLILTAIVWLIFSIRLLGIRIDFSFVNFSEFKKLISYSSLAFLGNAAQFLNYRFDIWVVDYYCGKTQLGYYALAAMVAQLLWLLANPVSAVIFPYSSAASDNREAVKRTILLSKMVMFSSVLTGLLLIIFSGFIIPEIYGPEFVNSIVALNILAAAIGLTNFSRVISAFISGTGKVKFNVYASYLGLIITIILDFVLVPKIGIVGAAFASLLSYCMTAVYVYLIFLRLTSSNPFRLFYFSRRDFGILRSNLFSIYGKR